MGTWTASVAELKSLTEFLEGLAELSNRTGVIACLYGSTEVEVGSTSLGINSKRDEAGVISYFIDEHDA